MHRLQSVLLITAALSAVALGAVENHRIDSLPGFTGTINFKQYSGLVNVDAEHNKQLFYWFVESQRNPSKDPIILWLNGGPGASSLLGLLVEHGPFTPNPDGATLSANPYSWNRVANVIYLESPVFVGFSTSSDSGDWKTNDATVAADAYRFLEKWFTELFPEFLGNDFYITGESYGGHYVPQLADEVLHRDTSKRLNLKGLLIGNPGVNSDWYEESADPRTDAWSFVTTMFSHGLVPMDAYSRASEACGWGHYMSDCTSNWTRPSRECLDAVDIAIDYMPMDKLDVYNVNAPVCLDGSPFNDYVRWSYAANARRSRIQSQSAKKNSRTESFDPCVFLYATKYMNRPDVQKALHAPQMQWVPVSELQYSEESMHLNVIPLFDSFFRNPRSAHWRILVFSGDLDAAVPALGTQKWISCLNRPVVEGWRIWYVNKQIAGAITQWDKISFITVHGSGHATPFYTPEKAFAFFSRWIDKTPF